MKLDRFQYSGQVKSSVLNVIIELKSKRGKRHTESDQNGSFMFDGLGEADDSVSVFASSFLDRSELLSGPTRVHIQDETCNMMTILVLSRSVGR